MKKNCIFFQKYLVMCSGYALAFYDAVVSSDAALVCTMFDQFPRSYGRKMQPIRFFFCSKNAKKHKKCIFFALFFKKICVCAFFVVPLHSLSKRKYDIRSRCYRLVAQDNGLSRRKPGFDSPQHYKENCLNSQAVFCFYLQYPCKTLAIGVLYVLTATQLLS